MLGMVYIGYLYGYYEGYLWPRRVFTYFNIYQKFPLSEESGGTMFIVCGLVPQLR
jgi:hypothetical protein